eukprot:CAMPEP_0170542442 /NCGR_PEP_ID=MMETSP0211-20121228/1861_1 /TAXON_ID=311385 /ORGANISM="Pseudokeronopsis sp., Strain OXSARD2" /LENGTH=144 /DNA_ID=CAMNT_0010845501 /DNA_START=401 /DNA_END=835 /DNA_ORIENTATION=+
MELLDRAFLPENSQVLTPQNTILYTFTCFLIASKFDELDKNIPFATNLQQFFYQMTKKDGFPQPSYNDIIECERNLMKFYEWDLNFVLPIHIINALLANGVVFEKELGHSPLNYEEQIDQNLNFSQEVCLSVELIQETVFKNME